MEWLVEVQKQHKRWVAIVKSFGAENIAEDIVQDVYIRLLERATKEKVFPNGKLNSGYIFFTIRNTYLDHYRKHRGCTDKNRFKFVHFEDYDNIDGYMLNDAWQPSSMLRKKRLYKEKILMRMWKAGQNDLNQNKLMEAKHQLIIDKVKKEIKTWHWYDQMLFHEYVNTGKSIVTLATESKISRSSIFQTLKNCKQRIKNVIAEDWEDFRNEDFEKII